ncbi:MAG: 4-hydroxy-tetrahydrodipicolinate synthase [Alphaproteobacteria bacterium]|nr:4-hydroxy-tetrahydrodipicolinate synthase [Alphaproteobacteria bacterium]
MADSRFKGAFTATITPMSDGKVDEKALEKFVEWQIAQGIHGLVPCGTTGESPTLSHAEDKRVTEITIAVAGGRVPVVAGTGSNSTEEAIELTRAAKENGADAAMLVCPYYNKPTQEMMVRHFEAVASAVDIPILIYNVPGRTAVDMTPETMGRLAKVDNIIGVKDASNDVVRPYRTREQCGADFVNLSGEDGTQLAFRIADGHGVISVTANVAPALVSQLHEACHKDDYTAAKRIQERLMPLHDALFCETNPAPVKYAASLLGLCKSDLRLPMSEISDGAKRQVEAAMRSAGILN